MSQCESWERGRLANRGDLLEKPLSRGRRGERGGERRDDMKQCSHLSGAAGRKANPPSRKAPLQTAIAHLSKPTELRQSSWMLGNSPTGCFQLCEPSRPGANVLLSLFPPNLHFWMAVESLMELCPAPLSPHTQKGQDTGRTESFIFTLTQRFFL